jgi:hypothetical protein
VILKVFQKPEPEGFYFIPLFGKTLKTQNQLLLTKSKKVWQGFIKNCTRLDHIPSVWHRSVAAPSVANPSVDCLLQLVTSSSPIFSSSFFLESIAFFSLFFWLLQVLLGLLHFFLAIGVLCFFIVLLLVSSIHLALCVHDSTNLRNTLLVAVS